MTDQNDDLKESSEQTDDQLFDEVQREAGIQAIQRITTLQVEDIAYIRERFPVNDLDLLSMRVGSIRNIPTDIRNRIAGFQARVRKVIELVASETEERKYGKTADDISTMEISANEKQRVNALVSAEKKVFISFESLRNTIELLSRVNVFILEKIDESEKSKDEATERKMVLANALLVYELTDYVINYIEAFSFQGVNEIKAIYQEELQKLQDLENQANDLRQRAGTASSPQIRAATLEYANNIQNSVGVMRQEWTIYLGDLSKLIRSVRATRSMVTDLKLMRDSASLQIDFISSALTLGILRKNYLALFGLGPRAGNLETGFHEPGSGPAVVLWEKLGVFTVEIKNQNLSKLSKDRLYQLLVAKDISESEQATVKNELVKREADELFHQAQRVRTGEPFQPAPGNQTAGHNPSLLRKVNPFAWVVLIVLAVLISIVLYSMFLR